MRDILSDFSGGLTDFKFGAMKNQYEIADNFLINKDRSLDTRYGSHIYNSTYYQIPDGEVDINSYFIFQNQLFIQAAKKVHYIDSSGWNTLQKDNDVFNNGDSDSIASFVEWNKHILAVNSDLSYPAKIYKDETDTYQVRTAGLPALASDPTITPDADDSKSYIYYFLHFYEYKVGSSTTWQDFGATNFVASENSADISGSGHYNQITAIPVIVNGSTYNYDTTNIKIKIYRTVHNGSEGFYVGEVTNGTTVFEDTVADADLLNNESIYISGGVLDNNTPPMAKYITIAKNACWYANVKEGTEEKPFRVRQSKQLDIDSCPEGSFIDMDGTITGIGTINNFPIVFTENKIYRIEGVFDERGGGYLTSKVISDKVGCVSAGSIITTLKGLYFWGNDAVYFTDGYKIIQVSNKPNQGFTLSNTYVDLVDTDIKKSKIRSAYDKANNRIYWAVRTEDAFDNDKIYVYSETFDGFTTLSGASDFDSTAIIFENGDLVRGDSKGYTYKHSSSNYTDLVRDTSTNPSNWKHIEIVYNFRHIAYDFGQPDIRKWCNRITVQGKTDTDLHLAINSHDDDKLPKALKEISYINGITWGEDNFIWSDDSAIWDWSYLMSKTRRFAAGRIRSRYKQIDFTNADVNLQISDDFTTATVDSSAKTITMDNVDLRWIQKAERYYISFSDDNYTNKFLITDRTDSVLTVSDDDGNLVSGSAKKWNISGIAKKERFNLKTMIITYNLLDDHGGFFIKSQDSKENE